MVHGWSPCPCATERVISLWGTLCHHVESGVSRFIPSTLRANVAYALTGAPQASRRASARSRTGGGGDRAGGRARTSPLDGVRHDGVRLGARHGGAVRR